MYTLRTPKPWIGYDLLTTGDGRRIEKWNNLVISRPEPHALWRADTLPNCEASFRDGSWEGVSITDEAVSWEGVSLQIKQTSFGHMGVFPDSAVVWEDLISYIRTRKSEDKDTRILSAFAYTGGSSISAALEGAEVCHCDASAGTVRWASENAERNGVRDKIRWIVDDARGFMARETRRERKYDVIILDPPVFGRGPNGEVWRLTEHLEELLSHANELLSPGGILYLTWYAPETYPYSVLRLVESFLQIEQFSALGLQEVMTKKTLQTSFFVTARRA